MKYVYIEITQNGIPTQRLDVSNETPETREKIKDAILETQKSFYKFTNRNCHIREYPSEVISVEEMIRREISGRASYKTDKEVQVGKSI